MLGWGAKKLFTSKAFRTQPKEAVTDRSHSAEHEDPLAYPHEARAMQLARVMNCRDSRQKPSYAQVHIKWKWQTLVSYRCLDPCYHTALWPIQAEIPHCKAAVLQLTGELILSTQSQAYLCPRGFAWLCSHPKDGQLREGLLGHLFGIHSFNMLRSEWQATILQMTSSFYIDQ